MRSHCLSELTELEGRLWSTVSSGRVLNARPRSWHASLVTAGCEAREKAQGQVFHPPVTGKGKTGRANYVNPRKPRYREPRTVEAAPRDRVRRWEAAVVAEVSMSATRAPRPRGIGGARHRSHLSSAEHGNPVTVRWIRPATGRPTARKADTRGGKGRLRSQWRQPKGDRKTTARDRTLPRRSLSHNWPHTRPYVPGPKGC
jgi:hypothetical protein